MQYRRLIAWIALLATLFSAVSPTLAATVLAHEPAALARMLGVPEAPAAHADAAEHAHHGHHDAAPGENTGDDESPSHRAHGIYCSLCLNPSSIATIAPAPVLVAALDLAFHVLPAAAPSARYAAFLPLYRSRAPPRFS